MTVPELFQEVYTDSPDPRVRELYHSEIGFVQLVVSPDDTAVGATMHFLEQDWEPYQAKAQGISREGFMASLDNSAMLRQFASIVLKDQLRQASERGPVNGRN